MFAAALPNSRTMVLRPGHDHGRAAPRFLLVALQG
jgi:hypothetical protein